MTDFAMTPAQRKALFSRPKPPHWSKSHPAQPGTGPQGETCKTCAHIFRNELSKTYLKCSLMRSKWTGGGGTDVKAGDPACAKWEKGRP
jgi:hypothetical protein